MHMLMFKCLGRTQDVWDTMEDGRGNDMVECGAVGGGRRSGATAAALDRGIGVDGAKVEHQSTPLKWMAALPMHVGSLYGPYRVCRQ